MKKKLLVVKRDFKNIIKNPAALIIVLGVIVIPSLYAWINIKASWDPYENTGTIPVAIVNKDKGTTLLDKKINIGDDVVKKLKDNDKINWNFVDEKKADLGVVDGTYYASIQITEDFSKDLMSLQSDNPKKPTVLYKLNAKANPVMIKIVGASKDTLVEEITYNFTLMVNETIFNGTNSAAKELEKNKYKILKLKDAIISVDRNMDLIINVVNGVNKSSTNVNTYLNELKSSMNVMEDNSDIISQIGVNNEYFIKNTQETLNTNLDNLEFNFNAIQNSIDRMDDALRDVVDSSSNQISNNLNYNINKINSEIDLIDNSMSTVIEFLEGMNSFKSNQKISDMIVQLEKNKRSLDDIKEKVNELHSNIDVESNRVLINSIIDDLGKVGNNMPSIIKKYNTTVKKELESISDNLIDASKDATYILEKGSKLDDELDKFLDTAVDGSKISTKISSDLYKSLNEYKDIVKEVSQKLQVVNNDDLVEIISILQNNPKIMGEFMAEPFNVLEKPIFKIPNYGSAMTPIYTVLAIWVGGLILTAILKVEVGDFEGSENLTIKEKYFGKMITFIILGLCQGLVMALGNKFLLGVHTENMWVMILFALVSSLTFNIIIYTLVSLFGNVGKALSIVALIVQVAGSGGSYPIQVDPKIFRIIQPFLPFTYSLDGFREAIGGPMPANVLVDLLVLLVMAGAFIVFGYFFKEPLTPIIKKVKHKFEESGIAE